MPVKVNRTPPLLRPDQTRVLLRPFNPGGPERMAAIMARVMALPEEDVEPLLDQVCADLSGRHHNVPARIRERFGEIRHLMPPDAAVSDRRELLIGSHFLAEYSLESAALFNPSIIPHPDQSGLPSGALRFILSLRATGEGHISSITFRSGVIHPDGRIEVSRPNGFLGEARQIPNPRYEKPLFGRKLAELGLTGDFASRMMDRLPDAFSIEELRTTLKDTECRSPEDHSAAQGFWILACSNFRVRFEPEQELSERILFPATPSQRNGIEDARFVRFRNDDGTSLYYATFTAFDGRFVVPELVETSDFLEFRFLTLNGPAAENKGMAIFPRKVEGRYAMLSRQDNESIYLMFSDNVHFWNERKLLLKPELPWELVQLGNCGSPMETEAGWLVLSHGVGPVRRYCIGAFLLDRQDPSRVIGRLREPLLAPNAGERAGYVPNVVYTCGGLIHGGVLVIPYGLADHAAGFATVPLSDVLAAMEPVCTSPESA